MCDTHFKANFSLDDVLTAQLSIYVRETSRTNLDEHPNLIEDIEVSDTTISYKIVTLSGLVESARNESLMLFLSWAHLKNLQQTDPKLSTRINDKLAEVTKKWL